MAKIFLSYTRSCEDSVKILSDDIEAMGHTVWLDKRLIGGQEWWNEIIAAIQSSEIIVVYLCPDTLESIACKLEYRYARNLGIPILPVIGEDGISPNLLPPELSIIQFVDYRNRDHNTLLSLVKALNNIKIPTSLPTPLPKPPEVPLSYLSKLTQRIETTSSLNLEEQSALIIELKGGLRNPEVIDDILVLLNRFKKRKDLIASIADEINESIEKYSFNIKTDNKIKKVAYNEPIHNEKIDKALIFYISTAFLCGLSTLPLQYLNIRIDLFYYQIFISFYIGYKYNTSVSRFAGLLIFLPNLILHIYCMQLAPLSFWLNNFGGKLSDQLRVTYFDGKYSFNDFWGGRTLGVGYFIYASIAILVAFLKEKSHKIAYKLEYLSLIKIKRPDNTIAYYIFLVFLLPTSINIGFISLDGCYILHSLLIIWAYRFGINQILPVLFTFMIINTVKFPATDWLLLFSTFYGYYDFSILLISLLILCSLKVDLNKIIVNRSYYIWVIAFCFIVGYGISLNIYYNTEPYHFNVVIYEMILPILLWIGYKYGSSNGLKASVIWGSAMSVHVRFSENLFWGYAGTLIIIAAAFMGYFGGTGKEKEKYISPASIVLVTYFLIIFIIKLFKFIQYDMKGHILIATINVPIMFFINMLLFIFITAIIRHKMQNKYKI